MKAQQKKTSPSNLASRGLGIIAAFLGIIAPVTSFAESGAREDESGMFVWIFLGLMALIVVAQIIPALLLMLGMARGIKSVVKDEKVDVKK